MAKLTTNLMITAALLATAGCATKPKDIATVGPSTEAPVQQPTPGASTVGDAVVPGSAADFKRSVANDTIRFALDMYDIDPESRAILDTQAAWLLKYPNVRATIEGHCDERGTREYNLALGDRRATAAKNYLAAKGIDPSRLATISYGKERPVALGSDEESWAQNRRAVTVVIG
jgi:peptidoglycan-associated lipoprotein